MTKRTEDVINDTVETAEAVKDGLMGKLTDRQFICTVGKYALVGAGIAVAAYIGASMVRRPEVTNNLHVDGGETK